MLTMNKSDKIKAIQRAVGVKDDGIFGGMTVDAVYNKIVPSGAPVTDTAPSSPRVLSTTGSGGGIGSDHWLDFAIKEKIVGGKEMPVRRCVVIHFTCGHSAKSSIDFWRTPQAKGANAHLVIDRDGTVFQCRPFNRTCGHAGVSRWRDPRTKKLHTGCNDFSIGIEIANAGDEEGVAKKNSKMPLVQAKHRNGGPEKKWEAYPPEQLASVFRVVSLLMARYKLDDITGHECIAPERKNDPGPAFPMEELRKANGLVGLPEVCRK
jgi:N-acetyl-anhydromuramyl-L-alanine amidase AmpD